MTVAEHSIVGLCDWQNGECIMLQRGSFGYTADGVRRMIEFPKYKLAVIRESVRETAGMGSKTEEPVVLVTTGSVIWRVNADGGGPREMQQFGRDKMTARFVILRTSTFLDTVMGTVPGALTLRSQIAISTLAAFHGLCTAISHLRPTFRSRRGMCSVE